MMANRLDFIDISHWQGVVDFRAVAGNGVLGVIAKATEGTTYVDPMYVSNRGGALAADLGFAAYHYLRAGDVAAQMDHFLNITDPPEGARMVIDYEDPPCRIEHLIEAVDTLSLVRPDLQLTCYGASMLTEHATGHSDELGSTSLWIARYSSQEPVIAEDVWPFWSAWQFTDKGSIAGISGHVDLNVFNGSREACVDWFGPAARPPLVESVSLAEPVIPPLVVIDIVVPDGVAVEVSVNSVILSHAGAKA